MKDHSDNDSFFAVLGTSEDEDYVSDEPPKDEPNRALIISDGYERFRVLATQGRAFYWTVVYNGHYDEDLSGLDFPPEDEPGFFVYENCKTWSSTDWETGITDEFGISGTYRKATYQDFVDFGREDIAPVPPITDEMVEAAAKVHAQYEWASSQKPIYMKPWNEMHKDDKDASRMAARAMLEAAFGVLRGKG